MKQSIFFSSIFIIFLFSFKLTYEDKEYTDIPSLDSSNFHAGLYLPKGFTATVWAESPDFYNPTNMDVDAKGRIWVTEAVNYRNFNNDSTKFYHHQKGERVMILEDTDGDGKCDKSKVFAEDEDLIAPLGIAVVANKVIVSCAPSLIIYTDKDGDDKADTKEVFLTGFGGKDHDHSLHSLIGGPDGKWYFNIGNAGPHQVTDKAGWKLRSGSIYTGGSPYNQENKGGKISDDGKIWVGGLALRINPDGTGLKVLAHNFRNAYELALDSYGNMWQSDNDDEISCRTTYVMEGGNAGFFSAGGNRYWRGDKRPGQSTFTAQWHQEDPGVMPAGDNTGPGSPTGVVVYEGDAFGKQYTGMLLSCEAGKNVVHGYKPKRRGAGFDLNRKNFISTHKAVDEDYKWKETFEQKSKWFRPSDISVGTDGSLYIADWYDPVVGGHQMLDKKGFGRIYRITPTGKTLKTPKIDLSSTKGQIKALLNPAVNVRYSGFLALQKQGDKIAGKIKSILNSDNPFYKARAIWLLAQLGDKGISEVKSLLKDQDENVRLTAFRALKQRPNLVSEILKIAVNDPSSAVRGEAAIAMRDLPESETTALIVKLAKQFDGVDPWYLNAIGIASTGKDEQTYAAIKKAIGDEDPLKWSTSFSEIAWRLHPSSAAKDLRARANSNSISEAGRKRAVVALAFINTQQSVESMLELTKSPLTDVKEHASYWIDFRKSNDWFSLYDWSKIEGAQVAEAASPQIQKLQVKLLDEYTPVTEKIAAAKEMAKDVAGGKILVKLATDKKLGKELLQATAETISQNPDQGVRVMASDYFIKAGGKKHYSINFIAKMNANVNAGKVLFTTKCGNCHIVGGVGASIGPDLTNIRKKFDKPALLDAIINPSAALAFGYEPWLITMQDNSVVYGFMLSQGNTIVLKDLSGKQQVLDVKKVKEKKQLPTSIMPDPEGLGLSEKDLAAISTYLLSLGN